MYEFRDAFPNNHCNYNIEYHLIRAFNLNLDFHAPGHSKKHTTGREIVSKVIHLPTAMLKGLLPTKKQTEYVVLSEKTPPFHDSFDEVEKTTGHIGPMKKSVDESRNASNVTDGSSKGWKILEIEIIFQNSRPTND